MFFEHSCNNSGQYSEFTLTFFLSVKIHKAETANSSLYLFIYCCTQEKLKNRQR